MLFSTFYTVFSRSVHTFLLLLPLKPDVLVEGGLALGTLGQEVEADATEMLAGTEVLGMGYLVAFYLQLHQAPAVKAHLVTLAQVTSDGGSTLISL